jgi:hypothetical protein
MCIHPVTEPYRTRSDTFEAILLISMRLKRTTRSQTDTISTSEMESALLRGNSDSKWARSRLALNG